MMLVEYGAGNHDDIDMVLHVVLERHADYHGFIYLTILTKLVRIQ